LAEKKKVCIICLLFSLSGNKILFAEGLFFSAALFLLMQTERDCRTTRFCLRLFHKIFEDMHKSSSGAPVMKKAFLLLAAALVVFGASHVSFANELTEEAVVEEAAPVEEVEEAVEETTEEEVVDVEGEEETIPTAEETSEDADVDADAE
jgi:hypothetical protein